MFLKTLEINEKVAEVVINVFQMNRQKFMTYSFLNRKNLKNNQVCHEFLR